MEIGMLNFWFELLVTAQTKENYFSMKLGWNTVNKLSLDLNINIRNNQWLIFRLQKQAVDVAVRYRANGFAASEDAAFFLLLDLMTFFDLFHSKKIDEALDIISKIKVKTIMKKLNKNET